LQSRPCFSDKAWLRVFPACQARFITLGTRSTRSPTSAPAARAAGSAGYRRGRSRHHVGREEFGQWAAVESDLGKASAVNHPHSFVSTPARDGEAPCPVGATRSSRCACTRRQCWERCPSLPTVLDDDGPDCATFPDLVRRFSETSRRPASSTGVLGLTPPALETQEASARTSPLDQERSVRSIRMATSRRLRYFNTHWASPLSRGGVRVSFSYCTPAVRRFWHADAPFAALLPHPGLQPFPSELFSALNRIAPPRLGGVASRAVIAPGRSAA